ncbi:MAG: asparagine synthase (glutamine-hydrolyzing) [Planctomycetota bacterium]
MARFPDFQVGHFAFGWELPETCCDGLETMCGISGIFQWKASGAAGPAGSLQQMLDRMIHRGPDDQGQHVDHELAMGMRRLSIIDLADGQQPISNEDGRFTVVFNGEIYNYIELRKSLQKRGHHFQTNSDTEVIVHLFEDHGPDCVQHLRGMFAFAIWDRQRRELFIARDRLGIKPLYLYHDSNRLIFSSEIKSILCCPGVHSELDRFALSDYLSLKYVPAPRTLFRGIESLPPGFAAKVSQASFQKYPYWDLQFSDKQNFQSEEDCIAQLLDQLKESVRLRLRSDVPFGAFLSGGLDSSLIVALMNELLDQPVNTFSVGFDGQGLGDELPFARQVANQFGCNHHELLITANDFIENAEKVIYHLDQPIADQATVATYMVAGLARQHVKMVLTGEGGDELFAGYARYSVERLATTFNWIPDPVGKLLRKTVAYLPGLRRQKIALNALTQRSEVKRFSNWFPMFNDDLKQHVISNTFLPYVSEINESFAGHLKNTDATLPLDRMLYVDSKTWLPDYLLLRGDKLTMAQSLEARIPLLDHHLVEFACGMNPDMKLRGRTRKYALKKAAEQLLPPSIVHRKKQGFPIPIHQWLRNEANEMMNDLLSPININRRGYFDADQVNRLVREHESGFADHSTELWGLMSIEIWMDQFLANQTKTGVVC